MNKVVMIYERNGKLFGCAIRTDLDETEIFERLTSNFDVKKLRIVKSF